LGSLQIFDHLLGSPELRIGLENATKRDVLVEILLEYQASEYIQPHILDSLQFLEHLVPKSYFHAFNALGSPE
jgi:hypothetical protein